MSDQKIKILERALNREKKARKEAEKILEDKANELYVTTNKLKETNNILESLIAKKDLELKGVFKNIVDAYCVMDMYGNVLEMNNATFKLLACEDKNEDINLSQFVYPEDTLLVLNAFKKLKSNGNFKDLKVRIISKDKALKHLHINASLIVNDNGKPIAIQGVARDVTTEYNIQKNLIESENRLKALIVNLDSGILLEDEDCNIVFTNNKFCELFSIEDSPEQLKGQHCSIRMQISKDLFEEPDTFMSRMQSIVLNRQKVIGEELKMCDGKILERDYVPIFQNDIYKGHLWTYKDVTLKRNYSKNIEAERHKYSSIIANMNLGLVEANVTNEIVMVNQSFAQISGYSEQELLGMNAIEVLIPKEDQENIVKLAHDTRAGKFNSREIQIKDKKGKHKSIITSSAPNYDENGVVIGSIGVILDITEQAKTKQLLFEQKKQLDLIIQNSPVGIALYKKLDEGVLMVNEYLSNMLGFTKEEILNSYKKDPTHPDDLEESNIKRADLEKGKIDNYSIEKRYLKKDGSVLWARTNVNAIRDNLNNIKYQVAIVEDITAQREKTLLLETLNNVAKSILGKVDINEIALAISKNITKYLGSTDCAIYLVNENENGISKIAAFESELKESALTNNKDKLVYDEALIGQVAASGKPIIVENNAEHTINTTFENSRLIVPIINDGNVIGIIDSVHTDQNYFTNDHLSTLQNVARLVSLQLKNAINRLARDKAEANNIKLLKKLELSNNELQEYAHVVSHDLKSPLRSISALVSWIKEDNKKNLDDNSLTNIHLIESTLEKMELLISDVLNYSSIDSDAAVSEQIDLNQLILELQEILYIPEHIDIKTLNQLPIITGDKTRLRQLFQNLLSNAIKFIDKEKGLIKIDVLEKTSHYQFSVSDNGVGIEKKYHDKIFEMFHSLNNSKESTGIGLTIVKKIVDLYQGDVWLESSPGKGTTFHFTLKK